MNTLNPDTTIIANCDDCRMNAPRTCIRHTCHDCNTPCTDVESHTCP